MESFKSKYNWNDFALRYFSEHPVSKWSYLEFKATMNKNKSAKPDSNETKSAYMNMLKILKNTNDTPEDLKKEIDRLMVTAEEISSSIASNISARDSSTINAIRTGMLIPTQTQHFQQPQQVENKEYESGEDKTRFPSDLSIDHHPIRTSNYFLFL